MRSNLLDCLVEYLTRPTRGLLHLLHLLRLLLEVVVELLQLLLQFRDGCFRLSDVLLRGHALSLKALEVRVLGRNDVAVRREALRGHLDLLLDELRSAKSEYEYPSLTEQENVRHTHG